jgi:hypothetical protein
MTVWGSNSEPVQSFPKTDKWIRPAPASGLSCGTPRGFVLGDPKRACVGRPQEGINGIPNFVLVTSVLKKNVINPSLVLVECMALGAK